MQFKEILGLGISAAAGTALFFFLKNNNVFGRQPQKINVPLKLGKWSVQVSQASRQNNIPQALIYAIIKRESGGNPNAFRQEKNFASRGLMQISGPTARDMGYEGNLTGLMNPKTNIQYGTKYLKWLFDLFNANPYNVNRKWEKAVAAYNTGPGNIRRKGIINPNYVSFVLNHFRNYVQGE